MVVFAFVGGVIALSSLFLMLRGLFTARQHEVESTLIASPVKSLLVGALVAGVGFGLFAGLGATGVPPLVVIALIVAGVASLAALFGLATVATVVGERVLALRERRSSPFAQTSVGTVVLAIAAAVPFLGWFVIGPIAVLVGLAGGGMRQPIFSTAACDIPGRKQSPTDAESDSRAPVCYTIDVSYVRPLPRLPFPSGPRTRTRRRILSGTIHLGASCLRIYVGNLSFDTTESELESTFAAFGAVDSANLVSDRYSGRSRGFGFVEMSNNSEAEAAIQAMNGKELQGRALTVNEARPRESGGSGPRRERW